MIRAELRIWYFSLMINCLKSSILEESSSIFKDFSHHSINDYKLQFYPIIEKKGNTMEHVFLKLYIFYSKQRTNQSFFSYKNKIEDQEQGCIFSFPSEYPILGLVNYLFTYQNTLFCLKSTVKRVVDFGGYFMVKKSCFESLIRHF